jgi:hypothetical protein
MKVGQKVKVRSDSRWRSQHGLVGTIYRISPPGGYLRINVKFRKKDNLNHPDRPYAHTNCYEESDLEPAESQMYFQFSKKGISNDKN